ncbi:MAG: glucose-1-phosphate adenylyltransferase [Fastidiosipilaceae bacterium]|jgi:glucose-1-phosphate adenylyltransferase
MILSKKNMIAMILAGGQGSRLGSLTNDVAKPAVPYGSRYRIIDFPLSNCANSGIDTVGVLTQYQPLDLNTYVGTGHPWDLDRNDGGAYILPPYQKIEGMDWYKNTANSVYQNIRFIDNFSPKYVLILGGDHIYKMKYDTMLRQHIDKGADCTIAVYEVPWDEASRFGIMNTDESGLNIVEFEEKPAEPKSNLASMGIYIFTWDVLRKELIEDEANPNSSHDFGKDIIPSMLSQNMVLSAYHFSGYWKDVGTIRSLWDANMDILDKPEEISFKDPTWRVYSRNPIKPAHYIGSGAVVRNSCMTDGCQIYGTVEHSVLSHSVVVEEGAVVKDSVLMPGVIVRKNAVVNKAIISMDTVIGENAKIGGKQDKENPYYNQKLCSDEISVIDRGLMIKKGAVIPGNTMVEYREDLGDESVVESTVSALFR